MRSTLVIDLTRKGMVAAIVAAAPAYDWSCPCGTPGCTRNLDPASSVGLERPGRQPGTPRQDA